MDFTLPDFSWRMWFLIAFGGAILAFTIRKFFRDDSRISGFFAVIIGIAAGICGVLGIFRLLEIY